MSSLVLLSALQFMLRPCLLLQCTIGRNSYPMLLLSSFEPSDSGIA
jgi:hypothetical protein